ncbi:MAG: hypothetical protein J6T10_26605 [Methanobrevibacter sp.]|nr:hypothetical protein [Methanobrevibacter sp.]
MNEVEKMYENAGILKECLSPCLINKTWRKYHDCPNCNKRKNYPPFTAEKQLELIKLLSYYYNITISKNFENDYTFQCEGDDVRRYVFTSGQGFAEQIASFINMCYELLPEEERKQIKEILE